MNPLHTHPINLDPTTLPSPVTYEGRGPSRVRACWQFSLRNAEKRQICYYFPWMVYLSSNAPILTFSSIYFLHRLPLLGRWKTQRWQCSGPWSTSLQAACECSYNLLHPNAFSLNILLHHKINQLAMFCLLKFWYTTISPQVVIGIGHL